MGDNYTDPFTAEILTRKAFYYYLKPALPAKFDFSEFIKMLDTGHLDQSVLSDHIFSIQNKLNSLRIIDPAMGAGVFLIFSARILTRLFNLIIPGMVNTPEDRHKIIQNHIFGNDINPHACNVTKNELKKWIIGVETEFYRNGSEMPQKGPKLNNDYLGLERNFHIVNSLLLPKESMKQFNLVIGNPPFGNIVPISLKIKMKELYQCRSSEIAELFVELVLQNFCETDTKNRLLCFILPKSVCFYQKWNQCREMILSHPIWEVINLGIGFSKVNFEQVAIILSAHSDQNPNLLNDMVSLSEVGPLKKLPKTYLNDSGKISHKLYTLEQIIIFNHITSHQDSLLRYMKEKCIFLPEIGEKNTSDHLPMFRRAVYLPEKIKKKVRPGPILFINQVPDLGKNGILRLYSIETDVMPKYAPYLKPKLFLKVLRGSRLVSFADIHGKIISTEKIINFFPAPNNSQDLYGLQLVVNARPASFYLQSLIFSQTTETSRVLDPYYASRIPLPKLNHEEWEFVSKWGKLTILAYYHNNAAIYQKIRRVGEGFVLFLYFKEFSGKMNTRMKGFKSFSDNVNTKELLKGAYVQDFDKIFQNIIVTLVRPLPFEKNRSNVTNIRHQIWTPEIENLLLKYINNLLEIYHIKAIESELLFQSIYGVLGK